MKGTFDVILSKRHDAVAYISQIDFELWERLKKFRKILSKMEYLVLVDRIHYHKTLEQVGVHLQVTRERIRQMEAKALEKIYSYETPERKNTLGT